MADALTAPQMEILRRVRAGIDLTALPLVPGLTSELHFLQTFGLVEFRGVLDVGLTPLGDIYLDAAERQAARDREPTGLAGLSRRSARGLPVVPFAAPRCAVGEVGEPGCAACIPYAREIGTSVDLTRRNNVRVLGDGKTSMVFAHGFGCDQNMWRLLTPSFQERFRLVLFDHVGSGGSDLSAYDTGKYGTLHGYAQDINQLLDEFSPGSTIFVGHSVSAMMGMLADLARPDRIVGHVMVGPSPCYVNDGGYTGGFERGDIDELLATLESNYLGWSSNMAPVIMGAPDRPALGEELTNSFCRTDPEIAKHFARVTFLSDHRDELPRLQTPTLILQCSDDIIAPIAVGQYMHGVLPRSMLRVIDNVGHCPHLSSPGACASAMDEFFAATGA
jgi:sigma-B regulation protein RsbQ